MSSRRRRVSVFGSDLDGNNTNTDQRQVPVPKIQQKTSKTEKLPYVSHDVIESLHDMAEDIMDLATMQIDFSGRQPYKLKRPVNLATNDMKREWAERQEHRRLRDQAPTATFSREMSLSPTSPDNSRSPFGSRSPRNATYLAYQHAKNGNIRQADFSYELPSEVDDEEEVEMLEEMTLQERLEERRRLRTKSAPMVKELLLKQKAEAGAAAKKINTGPLVVGDYHLDAEGEVPSRTARQQKMMMNPPTEENDLTGNTWMYVDGDTNQKGHYMEKMSWYQDSKKYLPNSVVDKSFDKIEQYLKLTHVHGFQGHDTRNNVLYTGDGDILYTSAALGIVVDPTTNTQKFMSGHTDTIISVATKDIKKKKGSFSYVATGEMGRFPKIIIWESTTMKIVQTLSSPDGHQRGVSRLAFSPSGTVLASIGLDKQHTMILYNWKKGVQLVKYPTGLNRVFGLSFQPDISLPLDDTRLVTCGKCHLTFWVRYTTDTISPRAGKFGSLAGKKCSVIDLCFDFAGRTIGGTSLGHIGVWPPKDNDSTMQPLKNGSIKNAHDGPINSVCIVPGGTKMVSGCVDGMIKVWTCPTDLHNRIEAYRAFDTIQKIGRIPSVQSISVAGNKVRALIGTRGGDVIEMKISDGGMLKNKPLTTGHCFGELWGLASHPVDPNLFATSGDDKTVRMWSIERATCVAITGPDSIPDVCRSVAFTPAPGHEGEYLAIGLGGRLASVSDDESQHSGKVMILDGDNLEVLHSLKVATSAVTDLTFANDGRTLVVASQDTFIYLVTVNGPTQLSLRSKCSGHSSYIKAITVSSDDLLLMSNDGAGEVKYWNMTDGLPVSTASMIRDSPWNTNTCPVGWSTKGIWPKGGHLTDINSVAASSKNGMCVSGDDFGKVNLYNSPSLLWNAPFMLHNGHGAHVTKVCFNASSTHVLSIGGADRCAFVWKVVETNSEQQAAIKIQSLRRGQLLRKEQTEQKFREEEEIRIQKEAEVDIIAAKAQERWMAAKNRLKARRIGREIREQREAKKAQLDEMKQSATTTEATTTEATITEAMATEATTTEATTTEVTTTEATTTEATTTEATTVVVTNNTTEKERGYTRCVAMHTFEAGEEDDLGFAEGQIVMVTDKSDEGWWVGYLEDNGPSSKKGHFPSNYVKVEEAAATTQNTVHVEEAEEAEEAEEKEKGTRCVAIHTFEAGEEADLGFVEGQIIIATDMSDPGWWVGYLLDDGPSSKKGHFPANYVKYGST